MQLARDHQRRNSPDSLLTFSFFRSLFRSERKLEGFTGTTPGGKERIKDVGKRLSLHRFCDNSIFMCLFQLSKSCSLFSATWKVLHEKRPLLQSTCILPLHFLCNANAELLQSKLAQGVVRVSFERVMCALSLESGFCKLMMRIVFDTEKVSGSLGLGAVMLSLQAPSFPLSYLHFLCTLSPFPPSLTLFSTHLASSLQSSLYSFNDDHVHLWGEGTGTPLLVGCGEGGPSPAS
mmetsp:Transcript_95157/g.142541  ORF Transcript_95157/g.142541 Transcript_95157/m.142541 type:complete len:234 (-) Transcript_95157:526-1227(-)